MQLQVRGDVVAFNRCITNAFDRNVTSFQRCLERDAVSVRAHAVRCNAVRAGKSGRAKQTSPKARAFFISPIHETQRARRRRTRYRIGAQYLKSGNDAESSIQPATIGNRIQMAAQHQGLVGNPAQGDPVVSGCIVVVLEPILRKLLQLFSEPRACSKPRRCPRYALRAVGVRSESAKLVEVAQHSNGIKHGLTSHQNLQDQSGIAR